MSSLALGFIPEPITVPLDRILPSRKWPEGILTSRKFKQIVASIEAVGLIEPLSVGRADQHTGQHTLLDGHLRLLALQRLGIAEAPCLVATDDESYTYNNRINRISTIQEHFMICRTVERGVSPERLAKALDVDISYIHKKVGLLVGVCAEAAEMLKDQHFSPNLSGVLRKLKPTRQIQCVELMLAANNITVAYAQALLAATPSHLLVDETKPSKLQGVTAEQMARMSQLTRIDMLVHISQMDLQRNAVSYATTEDSPFDKFAPGWREKVTVAQAQQTLRQQVFQYWRDKVAGLGVWPSADMRLLTGRNNQPLYWLLMAAKHPLPHKFWATASNVEGQGKLDF